MAIRHKVNLNFHDVILPEDTTQPVEFAFCQNEKLSTTFYLRGDGAVCLTCEGTGGIAVGMRGNDVVTACCPDCNGAGGKEGWFVWVQSSADGDGLTRMHDEPFDTATEARHAGSQLVIEGVPRLVRELTKRLAMREGVYE